MEKQTILLDIKVDKKHSVCYKTLQADVAVSAVYIMRKQLGKPVPNSIKVTIEEAL
jgi:hypothetical protein